MLYSHFPLKTIIIDVVFLKNEVSQNLHSHRSDNEIILPTVLFENGC